LNGNARRLVFNGEKQKDYLEHKRKIFNNLNPSELRKHDKLWKDGKISKGYEFYLPTNKYLTTLYDLLYINKKRTITEKYLEDYNEISLAYHFMDDGNYHKRTKSYTICLAGFDDDSVNIYKNFLETNFKLNISIQKNNNVYIKQKSKRDFEKLIKNHIPKCMSYKINTFYEAHDKQGELLEHQEIDNQQLSLSSNTFESSTTRGTVLNYNKEDDTSTSALPVIYTNGDDIV